MSGNAAAGDVIPTGGLVVCSGEGCNVEFAGVQFVNRSLVVTAGAKVRLLQCSFRATSGMDITALIASGGSVVTICSTELLGGYQGVLCMDGARVEVQKMAMKGVAGAAAVCCGSGSYMTLSKCTFTGSKCTSVVVCYGAQGHLLDCDISQRTFAMHGVHKSQERQ